MITKSKTLGRTSFVGVFVFQRTFDPYTQKFLSIFFGQTFFRSRFAPSSLNFKIQNSSFGTIFQNQGSPTPIQKQCLFLGTHYTLSKIRNCISIKLCNKQKLGFRKVLISFVTNQIGLPTYKITKCSLVLTFLKNQLSYSKNLPYLEKIYI